MVRDLIGPITRNSSTKSLDVRYQHRSSQISRDFPNSKFQTINSFVKFQNAAKALQCKSRANHQIGISNLRLRYRFNVKSQKRTSRNIKKCQNWGKFVRNPFSIWGYKAGFECPSAQTSWHGVPPDISSFHSKSDVWINAN